MCGCAGVTVQRGKDISSAGLAYTRATIALTDVTIDDMIDAESEAQVRSFEGPNAPRIAPEESARRLDLLDRQTIANTKSLLKMKSSLAAVEAYFAGLQALANDDQSDAASTAVGQLADHVNELNGVLEKDAAVKDKVSAEQKAALSGLAKLVVNEIHGAKLAEALRRDASVIGEALTLQEQVLDFAELVIGNNLRQKAAVFYVDKVKRPYKAGKLDSSWVDDRRNYIRGRAMGEIADSLKTAREASKQMTKTWQKVLSGSYDVSEMRASIDELNGLLGAIDALKKAPGPKAPAPTNQ
jgi:hypothetical protein